jgi:hypothetical protein
MTKTTRIVSTRVVMALLVWAAVASASNVVVVAGQPSATTARTRVRGANARLDAVIAEAVTRSQTFRGLVDTILTTDGIVYVAEGECGQGVRACLLAMVTIAGPNRLLRIAVDPRKSDEDLIGTIGHELQHAIEVLSDHYVRSSSAAILRLKEICSACGSRYETDAAVKAGDAVRAELQKTKSSAHQ